MRATWGWIRRGLERFWQGVREWCGDAAYQKYVHSTARRGDEPVLSPGEFYVQQLDRKYSRPNRCC
jgi:uncharacterized short protein YbdD (DUF466 family)